MNIHNRKSKSGALWVTVTLTLFFSGWDLFHPGTPAAALKPPFSEQKTANPRPPDPAKLVKILRGSQNTLSRMAAARALGENRSSLALPALLNALKDDRISVRWSAVEALGELGNSKAVPHLIKLLQKEEAYRWNRRLVVSALGNLRDRRAVPALLQQLKNGDSFLRKITLFALKKIGDPKAFLAMVAMLRDSEFWVRRTTQRLLVEWTKGHLKGPPPRDQAGWKRWFKRTGFPPPNSRVIRKVRR